MLREFALVVDLAGIPDARVLGALPTAYLTAWRIYEEVGPAQRRPTARAPVHAVTPDDARPPSAAVPSPPGDQDSSSAGPASAGSSRPTGELVLGSAAAATVPRSTPSASHRPQPDQGEHRQPLDRLSPSPLVPARRRLPGVPASGLEASVASTVRGTGEGPQTAPAIMASRCRQARGGWRPS